MDAAICATVVMVGAFAFAAYLLIPALTIMWITDASELGTLFAFCYVVGALWYAIYAVESNWVEMPASGCFQEEGQCSDT